MKNRNAITQSYQKLCASNFASASRRWALTALLLCSLGISASATEAKSYKLAAEKGFTIAPNVQTPIVLKTMPDAACDLHVESMGKSDHKLRFYANGDGYVKIHASAQKESKDGLHAQLDCQSNGKAMRYPLHLRAGSSPTPEMPAPQSVMPTPKGSQVMPALSKQEAEQLSDEELIGRGFPPRPDPSTAPDAYAQWLDLISQPITMVPPHLVSRTDIVHSISQPHSQQQDVRAGFVASGNWSGFVDLGSNRGFTAVYGQWSVPTIVACEFDATTYSSFWVGLDGYNGFTDLVQDGTEHDCTDFLGFNFGSYSAWEELLPNQPFSQNVALSINPGDSFWALAWVGDANRQYDPNGTFAWFNMWDTTRRQGVLLSVPLNGTHYNGSTAEWIMERPLLSNGHFAELSDYSVAAMSYPEVLTSSFNWNYYTNFSFDYNDMYNQFLNGNDNNELSATMGVTPSLIYYAWLNYH